jgi:hypothetical protein
MNDVLTAQGLDITLENTKPKQLKDVDLNLVKKKYSESCLIGFGFKD